MFFLRRFPPLESLKQLVHIIYRAICPSKLLLEGIIQFNLILDDPFHGRSQHNFGYLSDKTNEFTNTLVSEAYYDARCILKCILSVAFLGLEFFDEQALAPYVKNTCSLMEMWTIELL